ncbi:MAG: hypothetical protein AB7U83_20015 [Vicinamibacterales bacterium]
MAVGSLVERVSLGVIGRARTTGEVVGAVSVAVNGLLAEAPPPSPVAPAFALDVARGVIRGASHVGGDLRSAAEGMVIGMLRGTAPDAEALRTIRTTVRSLVHATASAGGDLGGAARGAVDGAIVGARELGVDTAAAAAAAARVALGTAAAVGGAPEDAVQVATRAISGLEAGALPRNGHGRSLRRH